jgi:plasmid stabilization system protein ParE
MVKANLTKATTPEEAVETVRQAAGSIGRNLSPPQALDAKRALMGELRQALINFPELGRLIENPPPALWVGIAQDWSESQQA